MKANRSWIISLIFGCVGILFVFLTTTPYGPGVSGDAVDYISTADSLKRNLGFTDYAGEPYIYWPPLYPLLLAGISGLTGLDTVIVGWLLNALCFGALVYLTGLLFRLVFGPSSGWFYLSSLATLTSLPLLRLSANISSDPLFIVLVLACALLGETYLTSPKTATLLGLTLVAGAAALLRWHGVILVFTVFTIVVLAFVALRRNPKAAFWNAIWAGALASLPFALWVFGRNYRLLGSFMGYRDTGGIDLGYNLDDSVIKIARWFLPDQVLRYMDPVLLLGGCLLLLILLNRRADWRTFFKMLAEPKHFPWLVFSPFYYLFVTFTSVGYDHSASFDDRYYAPLFVFAFLFVALVIEGLVFEPLSNRYSFAGRRIALTRAILILLALVWLAYPSYRLYKYVVVSRANGEPTYNMYNTASFHRSALVEYLDSFSFEGGKKLYSNYPAAVYITTRQTTHRAPISPSGDSADFEGLYSNYSQWPADTSYLIWFLPNDWFYYYEPEDLARVADLEVLFSSTDGVIYMVENR
ncbi:MAG: hypothetical protein FJ010_05055 [Chloroflexi bacterium]|nr:hypothetical protein [Chloroflexota bacterium]